MRIDPAQRLLTWTDAFSAFLSHPIDGKGLGLGVAGVYFMPPSGELQLLTDAHNFVLNVAAQGGLIMVVPLLFICIAVVRRSLPFGSGDRDVLRTALGIAFISAFGVQGMVGSFEDARHLWVLIGLVLSSSALSPAFRRPDVEQEPAETGTQNATTALP
jgi:O-antigen ligase